MPSEHVEWVWILPFQKRPGAVKVGSFGMVISGCAAHDGGGPCYGRNHHGLDGCQWKFP
jgi:hypothetical protein